jgi:hypothetical protein
MTALEAIGGKMIDGVMNFGWERTPPEVMAEAYATGLVRAADPGEDVPEMKGEKVFLWEAVKHVYGYYPFNWQLIGSCVNGGGQNGLIVRQSLEILHGTKHEAAKIPFTLIAYGQARGANRAEGDGASCTIFAQKLRDVGIPPFDTLGLPAPQLIPVKGRDDAKCIVYSPATLDEIARFNGRTMQPRSVPEYELRFSTGRNHKPEWLQAANKYRLQFVQCRSADDVKRELRRGRPVLSGGNWGGRTQGLKYQGEPRVLFNTHSDSWAHQQSILGFWEHPTLGTIFFWLNQWYYLEGGIAVPMHGTVTMGEPPGGYWTAAKDVDYQASTGEVFAIHTFDGYQGDIDWKLGV